MRLPKLVCVVGTTASGKSDLAVALALRFDGEVVSADSMQIYKGFDIGTAKVTEAEMRGVAHHMLDVVPPDGAYSVADYCRDAGRAVAGILSRGRLPIVAGGTGLYVDSLIGNTLFVGEKADPAYRASLQQYVQERGADALHARLRELDPQYAEKTHANNVKRVIRAMELIRATGKTMAELSAQSRRPPLYDSVKIGLRYADRQELYRRIDRRVDAMLERGLLDEVDGLLAQGISPAAQAMQGIGYKELAAYRAGAVTLEDAVARIKKNSRNYAKRQLTWFQRDASIVWLEAGEGREKVFDKAQKILEKFVST